jgi:hypothetical protein
MFINGDIPPPSHIMKIDASSRITEDNTHERASVRPIKLNSFASCVDNAFDDKRVTIAFISVWFFICLGGFTWLGIFSSDYMRVGPSATLTYMGMLIDTMPRYMAVVVFVVISTAVNDFASDAISPWIQNTVMDHKSRTIPYSKFTMLFITQTWSLYCGVMSVASIALVFAQFDLITIRLVVDLFVNQYTIRRFLSNKAHHFRYHHEFLNEDDADNLHDAPDAGVSKDADAVSCTPPTIPYEKTFPPKTLRETVKERAVGDTGAESIVIVSPENPMLPLPPIYEEPKDARKR